MEAEAAEKCNRRSNQTESPIALSRAVTSDLRSIYRQGPFSEGFDLIERTVFQQKTLTEQPISTRPVHRSDGIELKARRANQSPARASRRGDAPNVTHHRAGGDDSPLETGLATGSSACDCSAPACFGDQSTIACTTPPPLTDQTA